MKISFHDHLTITLKETPIIETVTEMGNDIRHHDLNIDNILYHIL